jgi:hypothetical protein
MKRKKKNKQKFVIKNGDIEVCRSKVRTKLETNGRHKRPKVDAKLRR